MIKDKSFKKSMQHDDSDIYKTVREHISRKFRQHLYSVILVNMIINEHFVYKHIWWRIYFKGWFDINLWYIQVLWYMLKEGYLSYLWVKGVSRMISTTHNSTFHWCPLLKVLLLYGCVQVTLVTKYHQDTVNL